MSEYARVYLLDNPYFLDREFEYFIPPELRGQISEGDFVTVPFGNANRKRLGLVCCVSDTSDTSGREVSHKPIVSVCSRSMSLDKEMLGLCFFMKEQCLCTVGDAVRAMIPASALSRLEEVYSAATDMLPPEESMDAESFKLLAYVFSKGKVRHSTLRSRFGNECEAYLRSLCQGGFLIRDFELNQSEGKTESYCRLGISPQEAEAIALGKGTVKLRSQKQAELLRSFLALGTEEISEKELCRISGASASVISGLYDKGILVRERHTVDRSLAYIKKAIEGELVLSPEQKAAFGKLCGLYECGEPRGALLFGITGSGKTSVLIKLIDRVLSEGKGVIMLLPEISLTPQTLSIFCSRYGEQVAIIHSGLSAGERFDTHKRIKDGRAKVVIGTRSAVFAPVCDLGLIIIDEEQEHTYKSDMNPKYHARDIARYRCAQNNCLMVLASATPSFESYKKATEGAYTLVTLKSRYGKAVLPRVTIADMRQEVGGSALSPLGSLLCRRLLDNKKEKGQSVLFLNRRGYNSFISCRKCGEAIRCPQCSVSMTYHTVGKGYDKGELRCHWCGRRIPLPTVCPSCSSEHLAKMGFGTQRVEQELCQLMPDAQILRMDTDTTSSKNAYDDILGKFRRHEADVLLGTQMVTKGHDFPDVTLVGVLLADASLYLDDYRAAEKTFSMLTQVIGRAGRGERLGEAIIQTNNPDHECIRLACEQNYEKFYENEIRLRKSLVFPPFCDIVLLTVTSPDEKEVMRASTLLSAMLDQRLADKYSDVPLVRYGPFEAPVYKVEGKYRMRTVIKCRLNRKSRGLFSEILSEFSKSAKNGLSLSVDLNPSSL